jgi:type I restriction enzyme M protein
MEQQLYELPEGWENREVVSLSQEIVSGFACSKKHEDPNGHVHLRTHNIDTSGSLNFDTIIKIAHDQEAFGYWKVTVDRPLRLAVDLSPARLDRFERVCAKAKEAPLANLARRVAETLGAGPHLDFNAFMDVCKADADKHGVKLTAKRKKLLQTELCDTHEDAAPVLKKVYKPGKAKPDPIHGLFEARLSFPSGRGAGGEGKTCVVEYEPDTSLRDSEQVPLLEEGGIEAFFRREVLPYTPDAWIDQNKTLVGYEISFTRHFYRLAPMCTLDEIKADIYALEQETEGLLEQIIGEAS